MSGARKQKRLDAVKHPSVEERLQEEDEKPGKKAWRDLRDTKMPLKNGGEMELDWAQSWEKWLRSLLEREPEHYQALRALVEGHREEVSEQQVRDLLNWGFLAPDYTPLPGVQAIMKAAHRETPDGPTLVDPLDVRTTEAAELVQEFEEKREKQHRKGAERLLRILLDPGLDKDDGPCR